MGIGRSSNSHCSNDVKEEYNKYSELKKDIVDEHKVGALDFYWSILKFLEITINTLMKNELYKNNKFSTHRLNVALMNYNTYYPIYVKEYLEHLKQQKITLSNRLDILEKKD